MDDAIGGYFGLEPLNQTGEEFHRGVVRVQSARAALLAALGQAKVSRIWLPWYICDCIPAVVAAKKIEIARYRLNSLFDLPDIALGENDFLLYVNYFGLCSRQSRDMVARYSSQVILDASQAFFYRPPSPTSITIYSPRKFFGIPDGGYLFPAPTLLPEFPADPGSVKRSTHLLQRFAGDVVTGYERFRDAEASLNTNEILSMSALTRTMLRRIDYASAAQRRQENFAFLHGHLGKYNLLSEMIKFTRDEVPLCYPLLLTRPVRDLRSLLSNERIFVPTYWPELALALPPDASGEKQWFDHLLPVPCDQRYVPAQLQRMVELIVTALGKKRG